MHNEGDYSIDQAGYITPATWCPSPNYNDRPAQCTIDLLVIHNISLPPGVFGGDQVSQFFQNTLDFEAHPFYQTLKDIRVSSHLFINREGALTQFVPFHLRAWHAGVSSFEGRASCNDFSIGIELEGTDEISYTEYQYRQLSLVTAQIMKRYPKITVDRIVGHDQIAPNRKTDPGPSFNWHHFHTLLEKEVQK
jgi:AmpD protein